MAGTARRVTEAIVGHLAHCNWADPYESTEVLLWRWADTSEFREDPPVGVGVQRIRMWDSSK